MFMRRKLDKVLGLLLAVSFVLSLGLSALAYGPKEPITPVGKSAWPKEFPETQPYSNKSALREGMDRPIELVVPISGHSTDSTEMMMQYATLIYDTDIGREVANIYMLTSFHTAYPHSRLITRKAYPNNVTGTNQLMADLAAGTAPAIYNAKLLGGVQTAADKGLAADITEYVEHWPFKQYLSEKVLAEMKYKGAYYGFPTSSGGWEKGLWYRADWFKESGLFDAQGNPGPPVDWTVTDFREIAQKLTDPKKDRWGLTISLADTAKSSIYSQWWNYTWGVPIVLPDSSGRNSYVSGVDTPVSIRALQFEHDLIYKYKCAIAGVEISWGAGDLVRSNQAAMSFCYASPSGLARHSSIPFTVKGEKDGEIVDVSMAEAMGAAPLPKGPQGVRLSTIEGASKYWVINPTLNEEEKLTAFQYLNWLECVQYPFILSTAQADTTALRYLYQSSDPYKLPAGRPTIALISPRLYPVPGALPWLEEMALYNPSAARARKAILEDPIPPQILAFGGFVLNQAACEDLMRKCAGEVLTQKNADIPSIAQKYARLINTGALAYKDEALSKEVLQSYFTALGEFYKEKFPRYYENVWIKELWDKINMW